MSCTQFHSIKSFILRHAWLNLWDKHMTTGRINQVTLLLKEMPSDETFLGSRSLTLLPHKNAQRRLGVNELSNNWFLKLQLRLIMLLDRQQGRPKTTELNCSFLVLSLGFIIISKRIATYRHHQKRRIRKREAFRIENLWCKLWPSTSKQTGFWGLSTMLRPFLPMG
jgi:hypothetical protein